MHAALCDNVDTRSALDAMRVLITACNVYQRQNQAPNRLLLQNVALYLTEMFDIFGAPLTVSSDAIATNAEETVMPILQVTFHPEPNRFTQFEKSICSRTKCFS